MKDAYNAQRDRCSSTSADPGYQCSTIASLGCFQQALKSLSSTLCCAGTGQHWLSTTMILCAARSRPLMQQRGTLKGRCLPFSRPGRAITLALNGTSTGQIASCWTLLPVRNAAFATAPHHLSKYVILACIEGVSGALVSHCFTRSKGFGWCGLLACT